MYLGVFHGKNKEDVHNTLSDFPDSTEVKMDNFAKIEFSSGRRSSFDLILRKKSPFDLILRKSRRWRLKFLEPSELHDKLKIFVAIHRPAKLRVYILKNTQTSGKDLDYAVNFLIFFSVFAGHTKI